jgi:DNA-binding transcriptional LysR family regulator
VDVAFIRPPAVDFADLRIDDLFEEDMLVALPICHRLESSVMVPLAALAGEPFILYPRWLAPSMYDGVLAACCKAGFVPDIVQEAPQVAAAINLVAAGIGISIVPARCGRYTATASLTGRCSGLRCGRHYRSLPGATNAPRRCAILSGWRGMPSVSARRRSQVDRLVVDALVKEQRIAKWRRGAASFVLYVFPSPATSAMSANERLRFSWS